MRVAVPTIKALVLDLDGTFLKTDKTISPRNREAVEHCIKAGIRIIVATARPPRAVKKFLRQMPPVDCLVYYNGALVRCLSTERHTPIPPEMSRRVTALMRAHQPEAIIVYEVNDDWYTARPIPDTSHDLFGVGPGDSKPEVLDDAHIEALSPTKIVVQGLSKWWELHKELRHAVNILATDGGA